VLEVAHVKGKGCNTNSQRPLTNVGGFCNDQIARMFLHSVHIIYIEKNKGEMIK
jgi:hypothetical protein